MFPGPGTPAKRLLPMSTVRRVIRTGPSIVIVISRTCVSFKKRDTLPLVSGCSGMVIMRAFSGSHSLTKSEVNFTVDGPALVGCLGSIGCSFGSCAVSHVAVTLKATSVHSQTCFRRAARGVVGAER